MSITDPDSVDFIGISRLDQSFELTISDHLPWDDESHLPLLQQKLNAYLEFVESGQLVEEYPMAAGKPIRVQVLAMYDFSAEGTDFLRKAATIIAEDGYELTWDVLESDADNED